MKSSSMTLTLTLHLLFIVWIPSTNAFFSPQHQFGCQQQQQQLLLGSQQQPQGFALHASKNKQKITSRTQWANQRGYIVVSSSSSITATVDDDSSSSNNNNSQENKVDKRGGPPKLIIAGAPASGKGTQCEIIQSKYGVVHLSTGDMLRAAVSAQSEVGILAKEYMDAGKLVPDDVIIGVVKDRLAMPDCVEKGWLLDGFPRTPAQALALSESGVIADCFIFLNVPDAILVERVVGRRTDPITGKIYHMTFSPPKDEEVLQRLEQRSDDTEEKVKVRLEQFHSNVEAVKGSYVDIAVEVDGAQRPEDVSRVIMSAIDAVLA